jgi:4-amino-4-deoxy-L-arabinose transferase-like glycosyltransferase
MKLLDKLEKSKIFWSLFWISLLFFFLRLPSIIEPNWYSDEGIYQIIGMAINNGSFLYSDIWENKPPLLYLVYALFQGDQFGTRVASLIVGLFSVWLFFYLSQKLFDKIRISIITTSIFAILFATPFIEGNIANAENFMLLPIIAAGLLIYKSKDQRPKTKDLLIAGFLLGIAFLFKIVAVFDFAAFLIFFFITSTPQPLRRRNKRLSSLMGLQIKREIVIKIFALLLGFLVPLLITMLYFSFNHALTDFIRAAFFSNLDYVGYANKFIIPQGFLILKLLLLGVFVSFVMIKREEFSKTTVFVLIWIAFSVFNALFSQRSYTHYLLVILPSFCLLIGLMLSTQKRNVKQIIILIFIFVLAVLFANFRPYSLKKTVSYYQNAFLFVTGKKDVGSYQGFFDGRTQRDYQLASFIRMHTDKNDHIFIWGDSAQIYVLSKTFPINKYTVAYHIAQNKDGITKTQKDIDTVKPKYVIILSETKKFPFRLTDYVAKFSLTKATIYERSL